MCVLTAQVSTQLQTHNIKKKMHTNKTSFPEHTHTQRYVRLCEKERERELDRWRINWETLNGSNLHHRGVYGNHDISSKLFSDSLAH